MAVLTHLETDTGTSVDISGATAVGAYTANGDKLIMVDVSIDAVAGNGDYVMYLTRQIGGSGSAYRILPQTTMAAASGLTAISGQSGWITVRNGDVLTCYVDGLAGDTSTPDWSTRWFESAVTLVTLADDAITASKFDESTAYPLKSADTGSTQVARVGADSDTLETLSDQLDVVQTDLDNPAQYKADVSGLALEATLTAIKGAGWTTETLVTLKAYVDEIETRLTATRAGYLDKLNVTGTLAHSDAAATYKADVSGLAPANEYDARMTAIQADLDNPDQYKADVSALAKATDLQDVENKVDLIDVTTVANGGKIDAVDTKVSAIDTDTIMSFMIDGFTFEQIIQIMASVLAGKLTRSGDTLTFRDLADTVNRVVAETDANKQRTGMTYTV